MTQHVRFEVSWPRGAMSTDVANMASLGTVHKMLVENLSSQKYLLTQRTGLDAGYLVSSGFLIILWNQSIPVRILTMLQNLQLSCCYIILTHSTKPDQNLKVWQHPRNSQFRTLKKNICNLQPNCECRRYSLLLSQPIWRTHKEKVQWLNENNRIAIFVMKLQLTQQLHEPAMRILVCNFNWLTPTLNCN